MKTLDKTEKHKSLEVNGNSLPATERSSHVPRPPERLKDYVCFGTLHGVKLIAELFHLGNFIIIVFFFFKERMLQYVINSSLVHRTSDT